MFISLFAIFSPGAVKGDNNIDSIVCLFKEFSYKYQPSLIDGNDTLAVPRLPVLDRGLNIQLYAQIGNEIDSVDDYAFLIVVKLFYSQEILTKFSYDMCYANNNVILDICLDKITRIDKDFINNECFDVTTWDIYNWASKNKDQFSDKELLATLELNDRYMEKTYKDD